MRRKIAMTKRENPRPISSGLTTHHHERLARPHEAPAIPATFRTKRTANAAPNTGKPTDAVAVAVELGLLMLSDLS